MKTPLLLLSAWLSLGGQSAAGQATPPALPRPAPYRPDELVITNVNVVDLDAEEIVPNRMVVVRDGAIISVGKWVPAGRGVPHLDGRGRYLVPGLWDGRAHALATAEAARVALPLYVARGITSLREMPAARPLVEVAATMKALEKEELVGPRIELAGALLEAPANRASLRQASRAQGQAQATALVEVDGWHRLLASPQLPRETYLGAAAVAREWQVALAGPVPETLTLAEALAAGQVGFEGLDKLLLACSPREAELVAARTVALAGPRPSARLAACIQAQQAEIVASFSAERCQRLAQALTQAHAYVVPALAAHAAAAAAPTLPDSLLRLVPASVRQQWAGMVAHLRRSPAAEQATARALDSLQRGLLRELHRQRVHILAGSDAGGSTPGLCYGHSLVAELEQLVAAGLSPAQALRAATLVPAIATGHGFELGRIEPGYRADLVLLAANPLADISHVRQVVAVVLRGRLFDRAALAALATQAAQEAQPAPSGPPVARGSR